MYDANNVFAKIIRKELPCFEVYEDESCIAFLDAFPVAAGHTLLVPKLLGSSDLSDLPAEHSAALGRVLPAIITAVKTVANCDSVTVLSNVGQDSGQSVFHPHYHIIV